MSLVTYEEARPWARAVKNRVMNREMPPWYIDRRVGVQHFKNDESLTDSEIDTISRWVDGGAPLGNKADLPPSRTFEAADRWHFTPDLIVQMKDPNIVPAAGPDQQTDNVVDLGLTEDRWIQAIEVKPLTGYKGIHHAVIYMGPDEDAAADRSGFLAEYAVGKGADFYGDNSGRLLKAGTQVNFQLHLHSNGEMQEARAALAIKFWPKDYTPKYKYQMVQMGSARDIDIPPNTDNVRFEGYSKLTKAARLLSFQPHMHNRGKAMCVEAIIPSAQESQNIDGLENPPLQRVETISCVDRYRFAWHRNYLYSDDEQPLLPAGTILHVIGWKDNTAGNRFNPDPDNWVGSGPRTIDEMNFAWMSFYYLSDEEYKQAVADRKTQRKRTSTDQQQQQQ